MNYLEEISVLQEACIALHSLGEGSLGARGIGFWRTKPKLHLLQEILEYTALEAGSPSRYWTYMDESWGGWLATTGGQERRGQQPFPSLTELDPEISDFHC